MKTKYLDAELLTPEERKDLRSNARAALAAIVRTPVNQVTDFRRVQHFQDSTTYRWKINDHTVLRFIVSTTGNVAVVFLYRENGAVCALEVKDQWAQDLYAEIVKELGL